MKCDELKAFDITVAEEGYCEGIVKYRRSTYNKSEVDEAIAELKDKLHDVVNQWNEQCKEIAELKVENLNLKAKNIELQSFYNLHGNVDNYIDQLKAENERLKKTEEYK